ncbi:MAG: glycosyltransferase family 4 protein [Phycisphaerales bacterium]|nr:MAG: glycosyltransferase family 4 protein [Phycisphaerales bacterium]
MKICIFGEPRAVHLQRIVPGLAARGLDVHFVCNKPIDVPGATVERFEVPRPGLTHPLRWSARWVRYLKGFLRRFDVCHVHFLFLRDWGFTPEMADDGCLVATPWGSDIVVPEGEDPPTPDHVEKRKALLRSAHLVTAWGPSFARMVSGYAGIEFSDIALLPLGVDLQLFDPSLKAARRAAGDYRVGFFKGFRAVYGPTYLMRAIPTVLEVLPGTRFHLIGDGPQLQRCKELAGAYEVAFSVKWIPYQAYANIPNHLAGWDLTVIPSVSESFGAAALESSAMEVPVVASDVGGLRDTVVHGETGLLVPSKAPEQLADAIITLLQDCAAREWMGRAGREMVERDYDWQEILDRWVDAYRLALDRAAVMV